MSTYSRAGIVVLLVLVASLAQSSELPGLGEPLDDQRIADLDFTVMPDGEGLPPGSGDVDSGLQLYQQHCLACHGPEGRNGVNDQLAGGFGTLVSDTPVRTVGSYWPYATTLFDYIRRAMPYPNPGVLSNDEVYSLTAYLLFVNDVIPRDQRVDAGSLANVKMPNRDNFDWAVQTN